MIIVLEWTRNTSLLNSRGGHCANHCRMLFKILNWFQLNLFDLNKMYRNWSVFFWHKKRQCSLATWTQIQSWCLAPRGKLNMKSHDNSYCHYWCAQITLISIGCEFRKLNNEWSSKWKWRGEIVNAACNIKCKFIPMVIINSSTSPLIHLRLMTNSGSWFIPV